MRRVRFTIAVLIACLISQFACAQLPTRTIQVAASCMAADRFFEEEVWAKVGERTCLKCHNTEGDARKSNFILSKPTDDPDWCKRTREAFASMASTNEGDQAKLLLKVAGGLDHGGGEVLKPDSSGYRILASFVRTTEQAVESESRRTECGRTQRISNADTAGQLPEPPVF